MQANNHLYFLIYDHHEREISKLESKYIFGKEDKGKLLLTNKVVEPSDSAFLKKRLDIIRSSDDYMNLIKQIKDEQICAEGFKVEYLVLDGDTTGYAHRLEKLRDIGYVIEGNPDYRKPKITFALCYHGGTWLFGQLIKNNYDWLKHKQKPYSFSNSIHINIAKALINIAAQGDKSKTLLDTCCGVGTIMLEACFAGNNIEGCDINWKVCRQARSNLAHFNYGKQVFRSDIKDINNKYDAAIIDLPYNLFSNVDENNALHIIESASEISNRLIIVSIADIEDVITHVGLTLQDCCRVGKSGKASFTRKIWVCEKNSH